MRQTTVEKYTGLKYINTGEKMLPTMKKIGYENCKACKNSEKPTVSSAKIKCKSTVSDLNFIAVGSTWYCNDYEKKKRS